MKKKMINKIGDYFFLEGSSQPFNSLEELTNHVKLSRRAKKKDENGKREIDGRRFWSEKLQMPFRSNWEIELAELMTDLEIKWEYEPERFYFRAESESYLPDFYLPEWNVWIEVKGYMDKRSERRCRLFRAYHGAETGFFLYMKEERENILKKPELLFACLEVAQEVQLTRLKKGGK